MSADSDSSRDSDPSNAAVSTRPDRNLAMDLVRVTEAAAMGAARWIGSGDKNGADQAAVTSMRAMLSTVPMDGIVVIGEGEKDRLRCCTTAKRVGDGSQPLVDVAVDPIDGTRLTAEGRANAISVIAVSKRGTMFDPGPSFYMEDRRRAGCRQRSTSLPPHAEPALDRQGQARASAISPRSSSIGRAAT